MTEDKFAGLSEIRQAGLHKMEKVYGFEMNDMEGDFFRYTVEHLFGDIWNRPGLSDRDRRLLLIGLLMGSGQQDVLSIQLPAAMAAGELDAQQMREIVILMLHYAGWPSGSRLNSLVEDVISRHEKAEARAARKAAEGAGE